MSGNMLSRFTEFYTSDGEKKWRNRDREFENEMLKKDTSSCKNGMKDGIAFLILLNTLTAERFIEKSSDTK